MFEPCLFLLRQRRLPAVHQSTKPRCGWQQLLQNYNCIEFVATFLSVYYLSHDCELCSFTCCEFHYEDSDVWYMTYIQVDHQLPTTVTTLRVCDYRLPNREEHGLLYDKDEQFAFLFG